MKNTIAAVVAGLVLTAACGSANAKGCLSGAAVGGVAGHVAGHHAVLGAAAGCAINHHRNKVKDQKAAADAQRAQPSAQTERQPASPPAPK